VTPAAASHSKEPSSDFIPQAFPQAQQFQEFVPGQTFLANTSVRQSVSNGLDISDHNQIDTPPQLHAQLNPYSDTFLAQSGLAGLDASQSQLNPYAQQANAVGGSPFFQDASAFKHPLNYHLYFMAGPRRENLMPYQRSTTDFFIPDDLREDLQRKSEATLQTFANSILPQNVEHFHSLVALDTNNSKAPSTFGYPSWVYKATSSRDGHTYALRRIEGFRLNSEAAIRTVNSWKRLTSSSMVQVHDAFTGRWWGDSSLVIVTDFHPRAQTLAEKHATLGRQPHRAPVPEAELWGYIVQLASALKTIHEGGLAAQTVIASKVLVTSKNRIRLSGCAVLDIVQYEQRRQLHELQRSDLQDLGKLILNIAARNPLAHQSVSKSLELISRTYNERLRSCIAWLVAPPPPPQETEGPEVPAQSKEYNINALLTNIADKVAAALDSTLHLEDELTSNLMRELENGRLVRLLAKLNIILERPDTGSTPNATNNPALLNQPSAAWSETGERYYLKLFRDFVFHQVDHEGRPVLDLGHIVTCLNKLDVGIDEKIQLISRDEQSMFVTSYKEVKRGFESAWTEISKASSAARRQ
jgi:PAB-dependent poly(A)-specific ribonuclease subunit 3